MAELPLSKARDSLLLLVDLQERLLARFPAQERKALLGACGLLLEAAAILEVPVLCTEQYPRGLGPTVPALARLLPESCEPLAKRGFACTAAAGFQQRLAASGASQIVLCGMEAHICVLQSAARLLRPGRQLFLVEDAVGASQKGFKENAIKRMRHGGVIVTNTESLIFEWLEGADDPCFRRISALLKARR